MSQTNVSSHWLWSVEDLEKTWMKKDVKCASVRSFI